MIRCTWLMIANIGRSYHTTTGGLRIYMALLRSSSSLLFFPPWSSQGSALTFTSKNGVALQVAATIGLLRHFGLSESSASSSSLAQLKGSYFHFINHILFFLLLNSVLRWFYRCLEQIWWGIRFRRAQQKGNQTEMHLSYARLSNDDRGLKFIRIFEAFLESAPQLILHLCHFLRDKVITVMIPVRYYLYNCILYHDDAMNSYTISEGVIGGATIIISMTTSTLSLIIALTTYKESLKFEQIRCSCCCNAILKLPSGKFIALLFANVFGICEIFFYYLKHSYNLFNLIIIILIITGSRFMVIIGVIMIIISDDRNIHSGHQEWILIILMTHCLCAALFLWTETIYNRFTFGTPWYRLRKRPITIQNDADDGSFKVPYSLTLIEELFLDAVLSFVYLFTFLNTRSRWSRLRYITYYAV